MLLVIDGKPRGVRCDLTGVELFDKFTYYSIEGKAVIVDSARKVVHKAVEVSLDLDICEDAYNKIYEQVRHNLGALKAGTVKCDLSATYLTGKFTYWAATAAMVQVDVENAEPMHVTNNIFDLNISKEEADKLQAARAATRAKPFVPPNVPKKEVIKIVPPSTTPKSATKESAKPETPRRTPDIQDVELNPEEVSLSDIKKGPHEKAN